jgi:hypothetical protein
MHVASSVVTPKVRVVGLPAAEPGEVVCIFTRTPVPVLPTKLRGL